MYDIVIIGSGAAGLPAGIQAASLGLKSLIITKDTLEAGTASASLESKNGTEVVNLDKNITSFAAETARGDIYYSKAVILATGKTLQQNPHSPYLGKGLFLSPLPDVSPLAGRTVAMEITSEAGLVALLQVSRVARTVHCIHPGQALEGAKPVLAKVSGQPNISYHPASRIAGLRGKTSIETVEIRKADGTSATLPVNNAVMEGWWTPNSSIERLTAKSPAGFVKVNAAMETSVSGLFAAGDVTDTPAGPPAIAAGQGITAALSALSHILNTK